MAAFLRFHPAILPASVIVSEDFLALTMAFDFTVILLYIQSRITSVLSFEATLMETETFRNLLLIV